MREAAISNALTVRLAEAPVLANIVWENKDALPVKPYLVFENVRTGMQNYTLASGSPVGEGYLMISVVTDTDAFDTDATVIADNVAERFPYGLRLAVAGGGHVLIRGTPRLLQGFNDGINWRVPVRVDYQTFGAGPFSNTQVQSPSLIWTYTHNQPSAATVWVINHNIGRVPQVSVYNSGSVELLLPNVSNPTLNQTIITFNAATSGFALCQ